MRIAKWTLLIYLLLKPFYFFGSGGLQIADGFLLMSFCLVVLSLKFDDAFRKDFIINIKSCYIFVLFVVSVFLINLFYFMFLGDSRFILSILYYIFNLIAILTFLSFYKDRIFLRRVNVVLKLNIVIQLVIFLIGAGRYYGAERYMGMMNDPNQFGYYILISIAFIYIISTILKHGIFKNLSIFFLIAAFLILQSVSTGILLGYIGLMIFLLFHKVYSFRGVAYKLIRKVMYFVLISIILSGCAMLLLAIQSRGDTFFINNSVEDVQVVESRLEEKLSKANGNDDISIWEDRGYDIIYNYPVYMLFGAGEGGYDRYVLVSHNYGGEVHATFPSILFYYGIIPFIFLSFWIFSCIKGCDGRYYAVILALFIESFTLLNQRQSLFWIVIVMGIVYSYYLSPSETNIKRNA